MRYVHSGAHVPIYLEDCPDASGVTHFTLCPDFHYCPGWELECTLASSTACCCAPDALAEPVYSTEPLPRQLLMFASMCAKTILQYVLFKHAQLLFASLALCM